MIAYLIAFVTLMNNSIRCMDIGRVHQLLNILSQSMSVNTTHNPIALIKTAANSSGGNYDELVKLASLVCEHDIGLDLITWDGCTVIEEVAAHFLASMGTTISDQGSIGRSLSQLNYQFQQGRFSYSQYHDVFPLTCTYARNEDFTWRHQVAMRISSTRIACEMLDRTVERYIRQFDAGNLKKMLSKNCGVNHPDVRNVQVTYKQIGMMIPRKCQQMTSMYPQNRMPAVCTLLPDKTLDLLTKINYNLQSYPRMDKKGLINLTNSDRDFKVFHARYYIPSTCNQGEVNGRVEIAPACNLILNEHPEVMIPPKE